MDVLRAVWECYRRSDGETLGLNYRNAINGQTWVCGRLQGTTSVQEVLAWICEKGSFNTWGIVTLPNGAVLVMPPGLIEHEHHAGSPPRRTGPVPVSTVRREGAHIQRVEVPPEEFGRYASVADGRGKARRGKPSTNRSSRDERERHAARGAAHAEAIRQLLERLSRANGGAWPRHVYVAVAEALGLPRGVVHAILSVLREQERPRALQNQPVPRREWRR